MKPEEFLSALLGRHQIVRIVVLPCMCKGLHGFAPVQPLPLNLGHQLKPDMNISTAPTGSTHGSRSPACWTCGPGRPGPTMRTSRAKTINGMTSTHNPE